MQVKMQQVELDMEPQTGSKLWNKYIKAYIVTCLFNLYAEYIMRNARLDETQAGIKIAEEIPIISDMQMTLPLWQKVKKNKRTSWWKWKWTVKKLA